MLFSAKKLKFSDRQGPIQGQKSAKNRKNRDFLKFLDPKIAQNKYYGLKLVSTNRVAQEDHVEILFSKKC